ncbi:MAG TPA: transposase [Roseiarcus sp.]|nr:transposase [Roseiarcus sp.]
MGYDASKKVKGRKIHALVDTEGLPMRAAVHCAAIQDRDVAAVVFDRIRRRFNWLELVRANGSMMRRAFVYPGLYKSLTQKSRGWRGA